MEFSSHVPSRAFSGSRRGVMRLPCRQETPPARSFIFVCNQSSYLVRPSSIRGCSNNNIRKFAGDSLKIARHSVESPRRKSCRIFLVENFAAGLFNFSSSMHVASAATSRSLRRGICRNESERRACFVNPRWPQSASR